MNCDCNSTGGCSKCRENVIEGSKMNEYTFRCGNKEVLIELDRRLCTNIMLKIIDVVIVIVKAKTEESARNKALKVSKREIIASLDSIRIL